MKQVCVRNKLREKRGLLGRSQHGAQEGQPWCSRVRMHTAGRHEGTRARISQRKAGAGPLGTGPAWDLQLPENFKKPGGVSREEAETKCNVQTLRSSCREGTGDVPCAQRGWQGARLSRAHPQHRAERGAQGSAGGCSCSGGEASSELGTPAPPVLGKGGLSRGKPLPHAAATELLSEPGSSRRRLFSSEALEPLTQFCLWHA